MARKPPSSPKGRQRRPPSSCCERERRFLAATAEYAKDERVTIMSAILTAGFRFGKKQLTPVRDKAPGLERL